MRDAYAALKPLAGRERSGVLERVAAVLDCGVPAKRVGLDWVGPYEVWAQHKVLGELLPLDERSRRRVLCWLDAVCVKRQP